MYNTYNRQCFLNLNYFRFRTLQSTLNVFVLILLHIIITILRINYNKSNNEKLFLI